MIHKGVKKIFYSLKLQYDDKKEQNISFMKGYVWIGSGSILLPGVTIGKNNVAVSNPCKVIRCIRE